MNSMGCRSTREVAGIGGSARLKYRITLSRVAWKSAGLPHQSKKYLGELGINRNFAGEATQSEMQMHRK